MPANDRVEFSEFCEHFMCENVLILFFNALECFKIKKFA